MYVPSLALLQGKLAAASKGLLPILGSVLLVALLVTEPFAARAPYDRAWTTVGSAGTVDEADTVLVSLNDGIVSIQADQEGTLNMRYNVVATEGLFGTHGVELAVRFRDNGSDARVVIRLKRYSLERGDTTTLLTFDSNDFRAHDEFQLRIVSECPLRFNFFDFAYFLDVHLTKSSTAGSPALGIIQLVSNVLC